MLALGLNLRLLGPPAHLQILGVRCALGALQASRPDVLSQRLLSEPRPVLAVDKVGPITCELERARTLCELLEPFRTAQVVSGLFGIVWQRTTSLPMLGWCSCAWSNLAPLCEVGFETWHENALYLLGLLLHSDSSRHRQVVVASMRWEPHDAQRAQVSLPAHSRQDLLLLSQCCASDHSWWVFRHSLRIDLREGRLFVRELLATWVSALVIARVLLLGLAFPDDAARHLDWAAPPGHFFCGICSRTLSD